MKREVYEKQIEQLAQKLEEADAIVIGAASGMSAAAGYRHYYERDDMFLEYFGEFEKRYGFHCSFDGFYYRFRTREEFWAYRARMACCILDAKTGKPYKDLLELLKGKNYYVLTTNQDIQFTRDFPEEKLSAIQGDWRYYQCSHRCHDKLYDAVESLHEMNAAIDAKTLKVPTEMIPRCPQCGAEMEPWIRGYTFLEGRKYHEEHNKLSKFLRANMHKKILFLELGVGRMTPMFIQEPFWKMTYAWDKAYYITINPKDAILPDALKKKGMAIHDDIARVLEDTRAYLENKTE